MSIVGTVVKINLSKEIEKKAGGTYPGFELVYEDKKTGDVRKLQKHANTLKYNKALRAGLESLEVDDVFTLETKKNDQGYLEPVSIQKGEVSVPEETKTQPQQQRAQSTGGNWPTAEERARTQVHIIRQNSVTNAVNFVNTSFAKKDQTVENVLSVAQQFEKFIHTGDSGSVQDLESDDLDSGVE